MRYEQQVRCECCGKGGAQPVAVVGDKVYKLAIPSKIKEHLGHKVTITGKAEGDTLDVQSVKMAE